MSDHVQRKPEFAEPPIHVDWSLQFSRPETRDALAYWNSIRGERRSPARSALQPRAMRKFLTHVNLVNVSPASETGAADYHVTLQGAHGLDVFGSLAHRKLDDVLSEITARRLRECFNLVTNSGRPVRINTRVTGGDKLWLDSEHLIAPLRSELDVFTTIMWVFVSWPVLTKR